MNLLSFLPEHATAFLDLTRDEAFTAFAITDYRQKDLDSAQAWIQANQRLEAETGLGKWGAWVDGELVGMGGLTPWMHEGQKLVDITYRLRGSVHGKGFGRLLAQLLMQRGEVELNLTNLSATITPDNKASIHLIESLGFRFSQRIVLHQVETLLYLY